jgi:hypothetical protein
LYGPSSVIGRVKLGRNTRRRRSPNAELTWAERTKQTELVITILEINSHSSHTSSHTPRFRRSGPSAFVDDTTGEDACLGEFSHSSPGPTP